MSVDLELSENGGQDLDNGWDYRIMRDYMRNMIILIFHSSTSLIYEAIYHHHIIS